MTPEEIAADRAVIDAATEIPGYLVTSDGRVLSDRGWRGHGRREITPIVNPHGYKKVRLSLPDGRRVNRTVHTLIARAFLGPPRDGQQVRHMNGDRLDNRVENLRWGTATENAADRDRHGTTARGEQNGYARLDGAGVREIRKLSADGLSQRAVGLRVGVSQKTVWSVLAGKAWSHVA